MLNIEICDNKDHKAVYYRNSDDVAIRITILDLNHTIIQDVISEYDKTGKHICDVLFGTDPTEIIAYREYHFCDDKNASGWTDYKKVNGEFIKLHSKNGVWIIQDELFRCDWFYPNGELAFYDVFKFDDDIGEMCKEHSYFANSEVILDYADKPKLEHFDDYYLDFL
ncbi:hypothetical protein LU290_08380 [Moraxella nasibovis]|uniref:hypothetical protein n=1 Tax=Moraxella nasibovis TaxID=2904120 RepID=UPI00240F6197|nr:hypothetical protein [Moraxella nasibovis]WFF38266.1 hypothetical protein LU290_08380 [Moraxella nasibovis]